MPHAGWGRAADRAAAEAAAAKKAQGFGVKAPGMVVAKTVSTGQTLYSDFEACLR